MKYIQEPGILLLFATSWTTSRKRGSYCFLLQAGPEIESSALLFNTSRGQSRSPYISHCASVLTFWSFNCLLGLTSCLETELESATVPGSCLESIPQLASIPTAGFPELRTRIWSFILVTHEGHVPDNSTARTVFQHVQQAIHHDNLSVSRGVWLQTKFFRTPRGLITHRRVEPFQWSRDNNYITYT